MAKQELTPRTLAALNDVSDALHNLERAISSLELNEDDKAVFQRFANRISDASKRRVTVEALRAHLEARNGREQMTLTDWMEFSF